MRSHGGQPSLDWPNCMQYFRIACVGAGAAAPVAPAGIVASLSATPDFPKKANALSTVAAEIPTRTGVGLYALQYDASFIVPKILNTPIEVYGAAGMWAAITSVVIATRTITFSTFNAGGAATDLPAGTSMVVISCECQDSNT
jgi:hypothetical protein